MEESYIAKRITQLRMARNISEYQMSLELGQCQGRILFAQLPDGVNGFLHGGRLNILLVKELRQAHIEIIRDIK